MDASEYLHRVVAARKRAEGLEFQHKRLEQAANNVPGGTFDEPRASSGQRGQAPFVRFIDRILEAEKAAEEARAESDSLTAEAVGLIRKMPTVPYQNLLIMRYIDGDTWDDIGSVLAGGRTSVWRWHNAALGELDAVLEKVGT